MRETHHYVCKDGKQHCIAWYENGKRLRKTFNDANKAEVFYQQKLLGAVDKEDLILDGVTRIRKYIVSGGLAELEAKNAELSAKLEASTPGVSNAPTANVRLFSTELAKELGVVAATIFHQLCYMYKNPKLGKVLGDGKKYIFNTYREWQENHFPFWSVPTLERSFKLLEDRKRIVSKQPDGRRSRRKYYRPLPESINLMDSGRDKASICEVGIHQIEPSKASICELPLKTKRERYPADVGKFKAAVMAAATTATNVSDLIEKLQPLFPEHNVAAEYERCLKYRKRRGLAPGGGKKFAEWMLLAEKPLKGQSGAETSDPDPNGFPSWWAEQRFKDSPPCPKWSDAPEWARREFLATRRRLRNSGGRNSWVKDKCALDQR